MVEVVLGASQDASTGREVLRCALLGVAEGYRYGASCVDCIAEEFLA